MYALLGLAHRNPTLDLPHSFPCPTCQLETETSRENFRFWGMVKPQAGRRLVSESPHAWKAASTEALCERERNFHCVKLLKFGGSNFREPLPTDGGLKICFPKGFFFFLTLQTKSHRDLFKLQDGLIEVMGCYFLQSDFRGTWVVPTASTFRATLQVGAQQNLCTELQG